MLTELRITDVGVIDDVTLLLEPGLTVLTGETGAGKTMVVSALELLLGARADADRVRAGADVAVVEGCLSPPPPAAREWLGDDDEDLIVSREVAGAAAATSRSRARVGGRMAPVSALSSCVGAAVELHGQSDTTRLGEAPVQRELLDRCGGPELAAIAKEYRVAYDAWTAARAELEQLRASVRDRAREIDRLRFELDEIAALSPQAGEEAGLAADLARLEHAEALTEAAQAAAGAVTDDGGARDTLAAAAAALHAAAGYDADLDAIAARLDALTAEVQETGVDLRGYAAQLEPDPARLEALRERHAELLRLSRKYSDAPPATVDVAGVLAYADRTRRQLEVLEAGDERAEALEQEVAALHGEVAQQAQRLRRSRVEAGKDLSDAVAEHLAELAMPGARLEIDVTPVEPAAHGADRVVWQLAANPGEPALPLGKAASGGERSRVALAVRLALADADRTPVLVFDEIDAGIGGATGAAVGRKLAKLARGRQVLCVTHLAQLAAHADHHFRVEKRTVGDRTVADVTALDDRGRVAELSRMLSGSEDSAPAVEHAADLLRSAQAAKR